MASVMRFWRDWWWAIITPLCVMFILDLARVLDVNKWLLAVAVGVVIGTILRIIRPLDEEFDADEAAARPPL